MGYEDEECMECLTSYLQVDIDHNTRKQVYHYHVTVETRLYLGDSIKLKIINKMWM